MFHGSITALITPMQNDGALDLTSFKKLIEQQITAGTKGIVVAGTTGEAPTLTMEEQQTLIRTAVEQVKKRIPIIAGTGNYSTVKTIENTKMAMAAGADACLIITPYYNKPTQEGLYAHFRTVAESIPIPIILYNMPNRTGCDMSTNTVERLSHIPNIVGLKQGALNLARAQELIDLCGERIDLLTGNDDEALPAMLLGFKGVISVTANIAPQMMAQMCEAALAGNKALAQKLNLRLLPLHQYLFVESNPIPCKWVLHEKGLIPEGIRLPLTPLAAQYHDVVRVATQSVE